MQHHRLLSFVDNAAQMLSQACPRHAPYMSQTCPRHAPDDVIIHCGYDRLPLDRDGKTCGYCGYIRAIFFFSCANFLAAYAQTNHKHCAVLDCAKSN